MTSQHPHTAATATTPYRPTRQQLLLLAAGVVLAVLATHAVTLTFGLRYDDFMLLRPFTRVDFHSVLTAGWGPPGNLEDAYYRPLTGLYFSGLFSAFGLHAWALHVVTLVHLCLIAFLLGLFLWRDHGPRVAAIGVALYLVHPVLPDSTSAWITNHMHLLALLIVTTMLLVWQSRRHDTSPGSWARILTLAMVGAFIKEDTVVVLPALVALQWCRARVMGDVPRPTRALVAAVGAVALGLGVVRLLVFPHFDLFEHGAPREALMIAKIAAYAPVRSGFLMFLGGTLLVGGSIFVLILQSAGAWSAARKPASSAGWLWIEGAVLLACVSVPVAFVYDIKSTRLHLAVFAASLMLTAGTTALLSVRIAAQRWITGVVMVGLLVGTADLWRQQRQALIERFAPCGGEDLWFDQDTRNWATIISDDIIRWVDLKSAACAAGRYAPIEQTMDVMRWTNVDGHTLLVNRSATNVAFSLAIAGDPEPDAVSTVRVVIDGMERTVTLRASERTTFSYRLRTNELVSMRAAHRVDIASTDGDAPRLTAVRVDWPPAR